MTRPASPFRVLVVEDEFLIAMELALVLQRAGFHVVGPASTLAMALDRITAERPDAAVLDVDIRGERITPVVEALHSLGAPYVLATAYGPSDLAAEPALAAARNLGKPTPPHRLIEAMRQLQAARDGIS